MKKIKYLLVMISMLFILPTVNVYAQENINPQEQEQENNFSTRNTLYTDEWTWVGEENYTEDFLAIHPDFTTANKCSGYWISTSGDAFSMSASFKGVTISIGYRGAGNGIVIPADVNRWSRLGIYGDVRIVEYRVVRTSHSGQYMGTRTEYANYVTNVYYQAIY